MIAMKDTTSGEHMQLARFLTNRLIFEARLSRFSEEPSDLTIQNTFWGEDRLFYMVQPSKAPVVVLNCGVFLTIFFGFFRR
jgi:hypothetical protein